MVVVSILSGKGGVGKTTVASNIATSLSKDFDRRVIVLDTNVSGSHIRMHFGMLNGIKKTLPDVIKGNAEADDATYNHESTGVDIIPSSLGLNRNLNMNKIKKIAGDLAVSDYDFVIIDSSAGFGDGVMSTINSADIVLVVTNPSLPDVSDALKIVELAKKRSKKIFVVLNRIKGRNYEMSREKVEDMLDTEVLMTISEDEKIPESISRGVPVVAYKKMSRPSIEFRRLAAFLANEVYEPSAMDKLKCFLGF